MNKSALPTTGQQIVLQLTPNMPKPEFKLFENVCWPSYNGKPQRGYVIGIYWIDDSTALLERIDPGWHYIVSYIYGMTDANKILRTDHSQIMLPECTLLGGASICE